MAHQVLEKKSGEVKIQVTVDKEKLAKATDLVVAQLGKNIKVDGFRPGKAPLFMIEKEIGKDRFWSEVVDKVVPESYIEAVMAEDIRTISNPQITVTQFVPGEVLVFEALVAILPEVKDLKYKDLKITAKKAVVTKKEKEEAIEDLLKRSTEEKPVERAAKKGDRVEIDFLGTQKGLPFEGGESKNHPLVLGSDAFIPGFEEKIVGHKAGDEFDFNINFPKEYHAKNLAGQEVNFKVTLHKVFELVTPKPSDEWAKNFGFKDLKTLEAEVEKELLGQKEVAAKRETEEEVITKIIEKNNIEAPSVIVAEEIHRMVHEAEHNLMHAGLTMESFLEMSKKTIPELEEEMKPEAEKRVKVGIVLGEIARAEELQVSDSEIEAEIESIVQLSSGEVVEDDLKAAYEDPARRREIGNQIIVKKTLDMLWEYNVK